MKDSIVDLELGQFLTQMPIWGSFLLPNLVSLTVAHRSSHALAVHLLRTSPKLEKLVVQPEMNLLSSVRDILEVFTENNKIKELEMGQSMILYCSARYSSEIKLKLEAFKSTKEPILFFHADLSVFLSTQAETLKKLELFYINDATLKTIVEEMSNLKTLSLDVLAFDDHDYNRQNPSVTELCLQKFSIPAIKLLLKVFPNLKTLKLFWATTRELHAIVKEGKGLEKIYMVHECENSGEFYANLKKNEEEINKNIKFIIG